MFTFRNLPTTSDAAAAFVETAKEPLMKLGRSDLIRKLTRYNRADEGSHAMNICIEGMQHPSNPQKDLFSTVYPKREACDSVPVKDGLLHEKARDESLVYALIECETAQHNRVLVDFLVNAGEHGFWLKTRDLSRHLEDTIEQHFPLPDNNTINTEESYISPRDFENVYNRMAENVADVGYPLENLAMICSPHTMMRMVLGTDDVFYPGGDDSLSPIIRRRGSGNPYITKNCQWAFYEHNLVPDSEAYVIIPHFALTCFDWGVETKIAHANSGSADKCFQRVGYYNLVMNKPLAFMKIKIG